MDTYIKNILSETYIWIRNGGDYLGNLSPEEKLKRVEQRRKQKFDREHKLIDGIDHKICSRCHEHKPSNEENFYKNIHNTVDGLSPYCKECAKNKVTIWRVENPEKLKALNDKYNKKEENIIIKRNYSRQTLINGKRKEWEQNNKDKMLNSRLRHRKHDITDKEWSECKKFFNNECAYCGMKLEDHFIKYAGKMKWTDFHREHVHHDGNNDISNCVPSCKKCNSYKNDLDFEYWYKERSYTYSEERYIKIMLWLALHK
jgi:HNH endonuclease